MSSFKKSSFNKGRYNRVSSITGISRLLNPIVKRSFGKRGFQDASILTHWESVVGVQLAQFSCPERIQYNRGSRTNGVLYIQVYSAMATQITHESQYIIECVNQFMGYNAVSSIRLKHTNNIVKKIPETKNKKHSKKHIVDTESLNILLKDIDDNELKGVLKKIGSHILGKNIESKENEDI